MVDINKLKYTLICVTEKGVQLDVTAMVESLGWEEGEGELAQRITARLRNSSYNGALLSNQIKPGCLLAVLAEWGGKAQEVARGQVEEWTVSSSGSASTLELTAYDELINLQKSQDDRYIAAGTGTRTALTAIFNDWGVTIGSYKGPNVRHAKAVYKGDTLSDIILDLLDAAVKQGAKKCLVRAEKGAVSVVPVGGNATIYHFDEDSSVEVLRDRVSLEGLVTRVKVVGKENSAERRPVEAVISGKTQIGIRQQIYNRPQDDSIAAARNAAKEILRESEEDQREISISAPDVPVIRKGDKVHIKARTLSGYYIVAAAQHDADTSGMSLTVEPPPAPKTVQQTDGTFNKGDRVILNGAVYRDSYGNGKGMTFHGRVCKITIKVSTSRPCPYHVDGIGWVYPSTITKV